ncbi:MAG TPA: site-2 protease family protein, partial [Candidatus Binatus sp.]|nr:site-2 protease family protein [Candidatus Binatus sp.]
MSDVPPPENTPSIPVKPNQVSFSVYQGPPLETVRSLVSKYFTVTDAFIDQYGVPTFQVGAEPAREKFKQLLNELAKQGLVTVLRSGMSRDTLALRVFAKPELKPSRKTINVALFFATVATVLFSGYLLWNGQDPLSNLADPASIITKAVTFAAGLIAIIGLHEFGHKTATTYHKLDATFPYFIPGPPPIGTFGALISLRGPPTNRDQLFDLGLSGPVVGFLVTIIVTILSVTILSIMVPDSVVQQLAAAGRLTNSAICLPLTSTSRGTDCEAPLLLIVASFFAHPAAAGSTLFPNQQLWFAAHIGALLTFLNIVPAWQLDGGHISRATFGPAGHRIATIIGMVILFVTGYYLFAFLLL